MWVESAGWGGSVKLAVLDGQKICKLWYNFAGYDVGKGWPFFDSRVKAAWWDFGTHLKLQRTA
jgi:hypothetical protein